MYVVTGATGNIGREVVAALVAAGAPVRAVVREPGAGTGLPAEAEQVRGDLGDPGSAGAAFAGADAVFLLPGYPGLATAAAAAGAARVVQLSGGSAASPDVANAVTRYMRETEAELLGAGPDWTLIRPSSFMSNALRWRPQLAAGDTVRLPFADVPLALVHPADVAAVAAAALLDDGHRFMIHRPTGPEALPPRDQVAILGRALGRDLRFEPQGNDEARRDMLTTTPAPYVAAFLDFYVNGSIDDSTVRPTVEDVTGRPPRPFTDWTTANAAAFA